MCRKNRSLSKWIKKLGKSPPRSGVSLGVSRSPGMPPKSSKKPTITPKERCVTGPGHAAEFSKKNNKSPLKSGVSTFGGMPGFCDTPLFWGDSLTFLVHFGNQGYAFVFFWSKTDPMTHHLSGVIRVFFWASVQPKGLSKVESKKCTNHPQGEVCHMVF